MSTKTSQKKEKRATSRTKQPVQLSSNLRGNLVKPKFINKPLSNFELLEWNDYLKIPNFKGIF